MRFEWEHIFREDSGYVNTYRTPIFGGWLVLHEVEARHSGETDLQSMVFVPDINHQWKIKDD